jgi:hypothetical protein
MKWKKELLRSSTRTKWMLRTGLTKLNSSKIPIKFSQLKRRRTYAKSVLRSSRPQPTWKDTWLSMTKLMLLKYTHVSILTVGCSARIKANSNDTQSSIQARSPSAAISVTKSLPLNTTWRFITEFIQARSPSDVTSVASISHRGLIWSFMSNSTLKQPPLQPIKMLLNKA